MSTIRIALLVSMFVSAAAPTYAAEFPSAPPRLKDAEAQGLQRVSAEELKSIVQGKMETKGNTGDGARTFNADGSVLRSGFGDSDITGTWRIDQANNAYCNAFTFPGRRGYRDICFAVFRAPDGTHYFGYDIRDGYLAHVMRRANSGSNN